MHRIGIHGKQLTRESNNEKKIMITLKKKNLKRSEALRKGYSSILKKIMMIIIIHKRIRNTCILTLKHKKLLDTRSLKYISFNYFNKSFFFLSYSFSSCVFLLSIDHILCAHKSFCLVL